MATDSPISPTKPRAKTPRKLPRRKCIREIPDEFGLTPRQRIFVTTYIANGWKGTEAAEIAGYRGAAVTASQLLKLPKIRSVISETLRAYHLTAEQVLQRLAEMAKADISEFLDADGKINPQAVAKKGYLVRSIKCGTNTRGPELELHDSQVALLNIGKHLGLFQERVQLTGAEGGAIQVQCYLPEKQPVSGAVVDVDALPARIADAPADLPAKDSEP